MKNAKNIFSKADNPLSFGILVLPDSNMLSLAAVIDPLRAANRKADKALYHWNILSVAQSAIPLTAGLDITGTPLSGPVDYDVLLVVAGFNLVEHATPTLLQRLRQVAGSVRATGGVDGGGMILARSGILDGETATTHWEDLEEFTDAFPRVNVVRDRFTISGRTFTTGGASPALDMMLHLIRSRQGAELAMSVASLFIYDTVHAGDQPQSLLSTTRIKARAPAVALALHMMVDNIEEPLSIAAIAKTIGLSPRRLETLFAAELASPPGQYYRRLRLQEARRMVLDSAQPVQDIALRCGFASPAVFARAFVQVFGQSASSLRKLQRR